uniref:Gfo/Idh/MocA-like oxidoreductase N-terminal domain-containing protein n=1 Tax=Panagrolaimus sp. ES5 TaxID=591445 RepID=A0AC34FQF4_9BILA
MSKPLRWGIAGCGQISHDFAQAMRKCTNPNEVYALSASKLEKAVALKNKLGLENVKTYGSYEEMFADENVDVVYVGVVHQKHKDVVFQAMDAGKPVLCEKPIGVHTRESRELYNYAKQRGVFLMEATWSRFFPVYQHIRKVLDSKEIGDLKGAGCNFGNPLLSDNRMRPEEGSTPANDIGIYTIQFALWVFGEKPTNITAVGKLNDKGCDIWATIVLEFANGGKATLFYSAEDNTPMSAYISCTDGYMEIPNYFYCPDEVVVYKGNLMDNKPTPPPLKFDFNDDAKYNFNHSSGLRYEADHVYECLAAGYKSSDVHTPEKSLEVHEVLDEVRKQIGVKYLLSTFG